jgi:hypothetical protein
MTVATTFATTNPIANYTFNSADAEVAIELERVATEVKMHLLVKSYKANGAKFGNMVQNFLVQEKINLVSKMALHHK